MNSPGLHINISDADDKDWWVWVDEHLTHPHSLIGFYSGPTLLALVLLRDAPIRIIKYPDFFSHFFPNLCEQNRYWHSIILLRNCHLKSPQLYPMKLLSFMRVRFWQYRAKSQRLTLHTKKGSVFSSLPKGCSIHSGRFHVCFVFSPERVLPPFICSLGFTFGTADHVYR